jgi:Domain of unknown function (DUF4158)
LSRFFHLNDDDLAQIRICRGEHNRLGFALQLSTVRYLGTFLDDPVSVPFEVLQTLAYQLGISSLDALPAYGTGKQARLPDEEIGSILAANAANFAGFAGFTDS